MTREMQLTIITSTDGPAAGVILVYAGTPAFGSLVAGHTPPGMPGGVDTFGNSYPPGDWCADGYRLLPMAQVWPGMLLARSDGPRGGSDGPEGS